jgi:heterodisulfide reductase subunit A
LVLSVGVIPSSGREELSKMLKVPLNEDGFFLEAHVKLRPVEFATDGIFLCGLAHSPKPISENISQAQAAAAKAAIVLSKESIVSGGYVAEIDKEKCRGCGLCIQACYFGAISYNEELGVSEVNPVLCKGCGNCAVICPSGACQIQGFRDEQILSQVGAYII